MPSAAQSLVTRLLEAKSGANLMVGELERIYANDYEGDPGIVRAEYIGLSGGTGASSGDWEYLLLIQDPSEPFDGCEYAVTLATVEDLGGDLSLTFGGNTEGDFATRGEADTFFNRELKNRTDDARESHMKDGSARRFDRQRLTSPTHGDLPYRPNERQRNYKPQASDSPHWDGSKYAL